MGVGLLGCRTTEWKNEIVLGLLGVGLLAVGLKGCRTAVNIMLMRPAPLVGRAGGVSEGRASEGGKKEKKSPAVLLSYKIVFYCVCIVSFVVFKHKRELYQ